MGQNFDLHMHTTYCDGSDTAEDMVRSAIDKGLDAVGISGHSFTAHDTSYCMSREGTEAYIREIDSLKEKYSGKIRVLLGIEYDYYADIDPEPFDYRIGSVHYIFTDEGRAKRDQGLPLVKYVDWSPVDDGPEDLVLFAERAGLEMTEIAELYFRTVGDVIAQTDCDVVGHFDLLTKFSDTQPLFDTADPRYISAWKSAVDRIFDDCAARYKRGYRNRLEAAGLIVAGDKPVFEINHGAIAKGYRTEPYPAADQMEYIRSRGGILIHSSDSHRCEHVGFGFR